MQASMIASGSTTVAESNESLSDAPAGMLLHVQVKDMSYAGSLIPLRALQHVISHSHGSIEWDEWFASMRCLVVWIEGYYR
jgi:hypothetical protein